VGELPLATSPPSPFNKEVRYCSFGAATISWNSKVSTRLELDGQRDSKMEIGPWGRGGAGTGLGLGVSSHGGLFSSDGLGGND